MTDIHTLNTTHTELAAELSRIDAEIETVQAMAPRHEPTTAIGSALALLKGAVATPEQGERLAALARRRQIIVRGMTEASAAIQVAINDEDRAKMRTREPQVMAAINAMDKGLDVVIAGCDQLAAIRAEALADNINVDLCRLPAYADVPIREWIAMERRNLAETRALYQQLTTPPQQPATPRKRSIVEAVKDVFTGDPEEGELVA